MMRRWCTFLHNAWNHLLHQSYKQLILPTSSYEKTVILCICDIPILCFCDITKIFCFCNFHDQTYIVPYFASTIFHCYKTLSQPGCCYKCPWLLVSSGLKCSLSLSLSIYISLCELTCFDIAVAIYLSSACLQLQLHLLCTLLCMLMAVSSVPCFCNPWNCWFCTFQAATRSMTAYRW
jgi:hypothetical protein